MSPTYYQDPARYFQGQQTRQDQQIRSMLNLFMQMQQMKQQRGQQQFQQGQQMWRRGIEEQRAKTYEDVTRAQIEKWKQPPTYTPSAEVQAALLESRETGEPAGKILQRWRRKETPEEAEAMAEAKAKGGRKGAPLRPLKPTKPSAYELRKLDLDRARKADDITAEQYHQSLFGLKQALTPEEKLRKGASIRDGNAKELRDFYKLRSSDVEKGRIKDKILRKRVEEQGGGRPTSQQGYALDMPEKYIRAVLNKRDGVPTLEDKKNIKDYDDMFKIFQEELEIYPTFQDWLRKSPAAKLKGLDKLQIRIWYNIYHKEDKKFLGIL